MPEDYSTITTFNINYDAAYGYSIDDTQEEVRLTPYATQPPDLTGYQPGNFWGVLVEGDRFYGPYTTKQAAQSFIDDKEPEGTLFHMEQV